MDPRARALPDARTTHLFDVVVDLQPALSFGAGPLGRRVLFGSAGGCFEGPELRGEVLPGGGRLDPVSHRRHDDAGRPAQPAYPRRSALVHDLLWPLDNAAGVAHGHD